MNPPLIIVLCLVIIFLVVAAVIFVFYKKDPYKKRKSMLTDSENYFYHLLQRLVPSGCIIIPQPPVIGCFETKVADRGALNKIISKRFDFAIAVQEQSPDYPYFTLVTVAVIELDDKSHNREDRVKRDDFINKLCESHQLPLLRYKTQTEKNPIYDEATIQNDILKAISLYKQYKD